MTDSVEASIELALLENAVAFATANSLDIAMPNGAGADGRPFSPPNSSPSAQWLRATVLPVPNMIVGIPYASHVQHFAMLQIDVLQGYGGGSVPMKRIVDLLVAFFPVGLILTKNGFSISVIPMDRKQVVSQGPLMDDGAGYMKIPVTIPFLCFARPA